MKYLDPLGYGTEEPLVTHSAASLAGKCLAIVNNGWASMGEIGRHIGRTVLRERKAKAVRFYEVPRNMAPADDVLERIARECHAAIVGLAN